MTASKPVNEGNRKGASRRNFIKGSGMMLAGGAMASNLPVARAAHAFGSDVIRIGLVGCGQRGTAAASEALSTAGGEVHLVAMADAFNNQIHSSFRSLKGRHRDRVRVDQNRFVGIDAYKQVMSADVDLVILATPPAFRPMQFEAAVNAGKHVFMEKPVAVDAAGVQRVLAAGKVAQENSLTVQVGLQRRHQIRYQECIEQLQGDAIGKLIFGRAYWNGSANKALPGRKGESILASQLRNWHQHAWLGGDQIDERHIHNLDVFNWLLRSHPIEANGQGGRNPESHHWKRTLGRVPTAGQGEVFDHHMVEFTYPGGFKLFSQCRQIQGCWNHIGEHVHGASGSCDISRATITGADGKRRWKSSSQEIKGKGWQQEQHDLFAALRSGEVVNEVEYAATSTMTAILGRNATYSGQVVRWDEAATDMTPAVDVESLTLS